MSKESNELIQKIKELIDKPGGKEATRFILNSLGSIPFVGGVISASSSLWAEKDQQTFNKLMSEWANKADEEVIGISKNLNTLLNTASKPKLILLLAEVIGEESTENLLSKSGQQIVLILNNATISELNPFIANGWLSLQSTGATCSMGANNRVGNHKEELKRPWGIGCGFKLTINQTYFD